MHGGIGTGHGIDMHDYRNNQRQSKMTSNDRHERYKTDCYKTKSARHSSLQQNEEKKIEEVTFENVWKKNIKVRRQFMCSNTPTIVVTHIKSPTAVIKLLGLKNSNVLSRKVLAHTFSGNFRALFDHFAVDVNDQQLIQLAHKFNDSKNIENEIKGTLENYGSQIQEVKRFHKMPIVLKDNDIHIGVKPFDKNKSKLHFKQCGNYYTLLMNVQETQMIRKAREKLGIKLTRKEDDENHHEIRFKVLYPSHWNWMKVADITKEEVIESLRHLSPYKAQSPDNIHNQMLKNSGNVMIDSLVFLFFRMGYMPIEWKKANITNFIVSKLMKRIITKRLMWWLNEKQLLHQTQAGLRSFDCNSVTYVVLLDISAAYDSVWRNGLRYKIRNEFQLDGRLY
ncbi:hypothetical protein RFI_28971 [Reticulomyxa filosa]|uniref:Reverse transcriptase domain-containing protein n=1 Tax=Reticulomyxa filosa TaxID=46433 RepID=X6M490_RETFI|nr:hypothetical protein RFI_28971 [Reticulomyxa filosa]|eukprot:ETO08416.1 hypothetical protein RFI_28971 [Reticulomyxa filosa]